MAALVLLRAIVRDHDNLFVAAEAVHAIAISILIYKLTNDKTCTGLSFKSQDLTAMFLAVRLYCSFVMEYDIHTLLGTATLLTTLWVIYVIRFKHRFTYMEDKDNFPTYFCGESRILSPFIVIPCVVLALVVHPSTAHHVINRICWAFCVYLEAVSVLPQLRVMQNTQVLDTRGRLLAALGYGLWPSMVLLSEIVQIFISADFCYYYVQSIVGGQLVVHLPSGVV
ncbi:hypothetical protein Droror1_Dr00013721 [Drosera rotundifolia]